MRTTVAGFAVVLVTVGVMGGVGGEQNNERVKKGLVGTWFCVSDLPKNVKHVKHITATHFTWVTYDTAEKSALATAGGTWSVDGEAYKERCDFASPGYEHLRGKEYTYALKFEGDKLSIKSPLGADIDVDEVWERAKPER